VCLPLVILPITTKSRKTFLLAPAHPGGPGNKKGCKTVVVVTLNVVGKRVTFTLFSSATKDASHLLVMLHIATCTSASKLNEMVSFFLPSFPEAPFHRLCRRAPEVQADRHFPGNQQVNNNRHHVSDLLIVKGRLRLHDGSKWTKSQQGNHQEQTSPPAPPGE